MMSSAGSKTLPPDWCEWVKENLDRGVHHNVLVSTLVEHGFEADTAQSSVEKIMAQIGGLLREITETFSPPEVETAGAFDPTTCLTPLTDRHALAEMGISITMCLHAPRVVVYDHFMSAEECEQLIALSRPKITRSTTVDNDTGELVVFHARTSHGTFFHRCENEFVTRLDERIARVMAWPMENGEGIQVLNYGLGAEYIPHFDYFPQELKGSSVHLAKGGQRVATLVMYLNTVEEGGETLFPDVGLSVSAVQGRAVYFSYFDAAGQVDPKTLHGGAPVIAGEKWIATKWMRQRPYC